jgi:hypothetical protein
MLTWFQDGQANGQTESARTDYYFCLRDRDSLGIKLREGRLEIKQRYQEYGVVQFHPRAAGRVEQWRKWSYELAATDTPLGDLAAPSAAWVGVKKARRLRKYQLAAGQQIRAAPAASFPAQGCDLEIAAVTIQSQPWWSLCLEAFGPEERLRNTLLLVAKHVFSNTVPIALKPQNSYGYARLLQQHC